MAERKLEEVKSEYPPDLSTYLQSLTPHTGFPTITFDPPPQISESTSTTESQSTQSSNDSTTFTILIPRNIEERFLTKRTKTITNNKIIIVKTFTIRNKLTKSIIRTEQVVS
eukprot:168500_1